MDKKLKIALIGAGGIANHTHLPGYSRMDNVELVAVCDIIEERAKAASEKYNIPAVYTDWHDVLNIDGLDAVDICTPNYLHSVIACAALEKGINVFCEKPDAVSVAEAEKMKAAAEKSGKLLMVMRNNRYWLTSKFLKNILKAEKWAKSMLRAADGREEEESPAEADGSQRKSSPAAARLLISVYI